MNIEETASSVLVESNRQCRVWRRTQRAGLYVATILHLSMKRVSYFYFIRPEVFRFGGVGRSSCFIRRCAASSENFSEIENAKLKRGAKTILLLPFNATFLPKIINRSITIDKLQVNAICVFLSGSRKMRWRLEWNNGGLDGKLRLRRRQARLGT